MVLTFCCESTFYEACEQICTYSGSHLIFSGNFPYICFVSSYGIYRTLFLVQFHSIPMTMAFFTDGPSSP